MFAREDIGLLPEVDDDSEYLYRIKTTAPQRAKDSFELWKKYQKPRYTEEELMQ